MECRPPTRSLHALLQSGNQTRFERLSNHLFSWAPRPGLHPGFGILGGIVTRVQSWSKPNLTWVTDPGVKQGFDPGSQLDYVITVF